MRIDTEADREHLEKLRLRLVRLGHADEAAEIEAMLLRSPARYEFAVLVTVEDPYGEIARTFGKDADLPTVGKELAVQFVDAVGEAQPGWFSRREGSSWYASRVTGGANRLQEYELFTKLELDD